MYRGGQQLAALRRSVALPLNVAVARLTLLCKPHAFRDVRVASNALLHEPVHLIDADRYKLEATLGRQLALRIRRSSLAAICRPSLRCRISKRPDLVKLTFTPHLTAFGRRASAKGSSALRFFHAAHGRLSWH